MIQLFFECIKSDILIAIITRTPSSIVVKSADQVQDQGCQLLR